MATPSLRLDHVLTFANVRRVETALDRYQKAGFLVSDHIAEWEPGLRNGFINLWPEYLELLCVDDSARFEAEAPDALRRASERWRPYGLGFYSDDTVALHDRWSARGVDLPAPDMLRLATTPATDPPDFCEMPVPGLEGADCFVLTSYYPNPAMRRFMQVAPNTVFGLGGVTLVSEEPTQRCRDWAATFGTNGVSESVREAGFDLGLHRFRWIRPSEYERRFGHPWVSGESEIGVVHLLAEDSRVAFEMMRDADWTVEDTRDGHSIAHHQEDGFVFAIEERQAEDWNAARLNVWGESLELHRPER